MSPRRKFAPGQGLLLVPTAQRAWRLMVVALASAVCMAVAITVSTLVLISHDAQRQADRREQAAKGYVEWFMTQFTTLDPFHANAYVTRVLAQATGDFAKHFTDKANQIIVQVARAEPTTGTVLEVGLERWNDDGSARMLVATEVTSKSPDEKQIVESTNRWTATAKQEGNQWKISDLQQMT